jgi:hypothetical protein
MTKHPYRLPSRGAISQVTAAPKTEVRTTRTRASTARDPDRIFRYAAVVFAFGATRLYALRQQRTTSVAPASAQIAEARLNAPGVTR